MTLGISQRKFAELDGCSEGLIRKAVKQGKLKPFDDGTLDPALARSGWRKGNVKGAYSTHEKVRSVRTEPIVATDGEELPEVAERILAATGAVHDYAEALRIKENYLALLRQLEYEEKSGALIDLRQAETIVFEEYRGFRDAWLNWPVRVGPIIAADLNIEADRIVEVLTAHVHKQLSDLGEPEADFAA